MITPALAAFVLAAAAFQAPGAVRFDEIGRQAGVAKGGDPGAVAWFDADGDGDEDLFVANLGQNRLFVNDGTGTFAKAKKVGIKGAANSLGVAVGDYDDDGLLDLFVANVGSPSLLYHNEGGGRFADRAAAARVAGPANSFSAAWADYDRDGLLDLYVANGTQQAGAPNFLYRNLGGGRFAEVGASARVTGGAERSLGCAWADYDDDGWPDLFVANFGGANRLYRNNRDGTFSDRAGAAGVADAQGNGAGAAWGDYDNDGLLDLFVFNTNASTGAAPQADVDRLYRNRGDGTFADVTGAAGVGGSGDGEAAVWADFDNDTLLDLFVVNRSDYSRQRNRLFVRTGGGERFFDVAASAGALGSGQGQPAAAADFDGDGRLDLFVGNLPATADELLRNAGETGNALVVRLKGTGSNRFGIGARVRVTLAGGLTLTREVSSSSGRSSQNQLAPHFGLGAAAAAARVEVRWPSGVVQTIENAPAGEVSVEEPAE